MLRAAYYAQELLSTFSTAIGEIALIPTTGGVFTINLTYQVQVQESGKVDMEVKSVLIWDRKAEGFPETKVLKQRVRDNLEPGRDLGHSDTPSKSAVKNDDKILKESEHNTGPSAVHANDDKETRGAEKCADCA